MKKIAGVAEPPVPTKVDVVHFSSSPCFNSSPFPPYPLPRSASAAILHMCPCPFVVLFHTAAKGIIRNHPVIHCCVTNIPRLGGLK